jgi:hypothetical protein
VSYSSQFGPYPAITYAIRDIFLRRRKGLQHATVRSLDSDIYRSSSVNHHGAMTVILLYGFDVGGDSKQSLPSLAASCWSGRRIPITYYRQSSNGLHDYIISNKIHKLRKATGYPT